MATSEEAHNNAATAIALINAYHLDHSNEMWDLVFSEIPAKEIPYVMFSMAAMSTAAIGTYSRVAEIDFQEVLSLMGKVVEEVFTNPTDDIL